MIRVAVDAMGGDRGAHAVVEGALAAPPTGSSLSSSARPDLDTRGLELVPTTQVVGMRREAGGRVPHEGRTARSSAAVKAVADGEAEAVVSAGNTGAMLAAGLVVHPASPGSAPAGDRRPDPRA